MMDEKDWLFLKTLYEKKSITKAAEMMYVTQPALTRRLQQIERELNVCLVERMKKGIQFTPEGEYLVSCADHMIRELSRIREQLVDMQQDAAGTLRIGASNLFTKYLLPDVLAGFRLACPKVEFKVTTGRSKYIYDLAYGKEVHVGFIRGDYLWPSRQKLLFREKIYICAKQSVDIEALPYSPQIEYQNDPTTQVLLDKWWRERFSVPPNVSMSVNLVDTAKEMVERGLGYAFLPETIVKSSPGLALTPLVNKNGEQLLRNTWMLYYEESMKLKIARRFVEYIDTLSWS